MTTIQSATSTPPELPVEVPVESQDSLLSICQKPGHVRYEEFLLKLCADQNVKEKILLKQTDAPEEEQEQPEAQAPQKNRFFAFFTIKPTPKKEPTFYLQKEAGNWAIYQQYEKVGEDAAKFFIAKSVYQIKREENREMYPSAFAKKLLAISLLALICVGTYLVKRDLAAVALGLSALPLIFLSFATLSSLYDMSAHNSRAEVQAMGFCAEVLGKENAKKAVQEFQEKQIDICKYLTHDQSIYLIENYN